MGSRSKTPSGRKRKDSYRKATSSGRDHDRPCSEPPPSNLPLAPLARPPHRPLVDYLPTSISSKRPFPHVNLPSSPLTSANTHAYILACNLSFRSFHPLILQLSNLSLPHPPPPTPLIGLATCPFGFLNESPACTKHLGSGRKREGVHFSTGEATDKRQHCSKNGSEQRSDGRSLMKTVRRRGLQKRRGRVVGRGEDA